MERRILAYVAVLVAEKDAEPDLAQIETAVGAELARFKHPRWMITLDALPRNTMGKVQKNVLRETYGDIFMQSESAGQA
ncbi:MAG: hypothetical protein WAO78_06240 [Roseovarius sp.]